MNRLIRLAKELTALECLSAERQKLARGAVTFNLIDKGSARLSSKEIQKGIMRTAKRGVLGRFNPPLLVDDLDFSTFEWVIDYGARGPQWRVYRKGTNDLPYAYGYLLHYWHHSGDSIEVNSWWDISVW